LGWRELLDLFKARTSFRDLDVTTRVLLLWPIAFPFVFAFIPRVGNAGLSVLIISVVLGFIIGVTEEALWRGVYVTLFREDVCVSILWWRIVDVWPLGTRDPR
jgi:membrane protease YdiL (CAAX protease family)